MKRNAVWALFVAGAAAIAISVGSAMGRIFTQPDADWYVQIARGKTPEVLLPFAVRQMAPLFCRALASVLHVSLYSAFLIEGVAALLALLGLVGFLLIRARANGIVLAAIGGLAFWSILFNGLALPDLWYAALLAGFLVLLAQKHYLASALMMFPLFFSRESTILTLFCLSCGGLAAHAAVGLCSGSDCVLCRDASCQISYSGWALESRADKPTALYGGEGAVEFCEEYSWHTTLE